MVGAERLVDPRMGIVRRVEPRAVHEHLPQGLRLVVSAIADTSAFSPWHSDPSGSGCALWDEAAAVGAAIGEAVERYCSTLVAPDLLAGSYDDLVGDGRCALDPQALALYSPDQYAQRGFPFVAFTRDLTVRWVLGRDLVSHQPVWVPASLVWVTYLFPGGPGEREPPTNGEISAGVATGATREDAEWSALRELVERDALALTWLSGAPVPRIEPPPWLARLTAGPRGVLDTRFYAFPSELGMPVVGALVIDEADGYVTLGHACRRDRIDALSEAFAEASQLQMLTRDLDDPASAMARIAADPHSALKPWRPDRRYLSQYRHDWRDVIDGACHLQLYLDPDMRARLESELADGPTAVGEAPPATQQPRDVEAQVRGLAARLAEHGVTVASVDITTADVREAGLRVIRLVATDLSSTTHGAFPLLGGRRLAERARAVGGRPLRLLPLPD
jgi:ribosomal protein S12 methylthiotransferase accessory factor